MDLKISENIKNTNIKYYADAKKTNYTIKILVCVNCNTNVT